MTPLAVLGTLLMVADLAWHWPFLRWVGYTLGIASQLFALYAFRQAQQARSRPVVYACFRCNFQGDATAVEAHRCLEEAA